MTASSVNVLLVDDDDVAAESVVRGFRKAGIASPIHRATDGVMALEMLRGEEGRERLEDPFIILLDLRMPRMDGIRFLEQVRQDQDLSKTVVFVLSTSDDVRDLSAAYERHVAGYIVKSRAGDDFKNLTDLLDDYWRVVDLPLTR